MSESESLIECPDEAWPCGVCNKPSVCLKAPGNCELGGYLAEIRGRAHDRIDHFGGGGMGVNPRVVLYLLDALREARHARELVGSGIAQTLRVHGAICNDFQTAYDNLGFPGSAETVARGGSEKSEACTDSAHDAAEWVYATLDYLVLDEPRPASLEEYVSKPTLGRKAKDKVARLVELAEYWQRQAEKHRKQLGWPT